MPTIARPAPPAPPAKAKRPAVQFNIKTIAKAKRFSLARLAADSGLAYSTVYRLANNQASRIDLATLAALSKTLGVVVGELFIN